VKLEVAALYGNLDPDRKPTFKLTIASIHTAICSCQAGVMARALSGRSYSMATPNVAFRLRPIVVLQPCWVGTR
jgi:hypothetical protein